MTPTPAYLSSQGAANTAGGDGRLVMGTAAEAAGSGSDRFSYDPRQPAMSVLDPECQVAPMDQSPRDHRLDILVYETEPFEDDVQLLGPVELLLWAATDAKDTDWMATLAFVDVSGLAINLTYGACRARFRHGFTTPILLTPDQPVAYRISLHPVGCVIPRGARLRLYLSSSDFPLFDRNHNTGADDMADPKLRIARQTVFHSATMPSRLVLPVVVEQKAGV